MIGIYKITNTNNEKVYIGQSTNIEERWKQHRQAIKTSDKSWYPLARQESDSVDDFTFEVLQQCKASELDELEDYWVDYYKSYINGYNQTKDGGCVSANTQFVYFPLELFEELQMDNNVIQFPTVLLHKAMSVLTYSEFKLFAFLFEKAFSGMDKVALSPNEMLNTISFAAQSYRDAKKALIKKEILVFDGDKTFGFNPFALLGLQGE
nr:MAG TPA: intron associated endonuclease [Caudoviricetes sp.]